MQSKIISKEYIKHDDLPYGKGHRNLIQMQQWLYKSVKLVSDYLLYVCILVSYLVSLYIRETAEQFRVARKANLGILEPHTLQTKNIAHYRATKLSKKNYGPIGAFSYAG